MEMEKIERKQSFLWRLVKFLIFSYLFKILLDGVMLYFWGTTLVEIVKNLFSR